MLPVHAHTVGFQQPDVERRSSCCKQQGSRNPTGPIPASQARVVTRVYLACSTGSVDETLAFLYLIDPGCRA